MNLDNCLETGYLLGLGTVGECFNNANTHAMNLFVYDKIHEEITELLDEIAQREVKFSDKVEDHIPIDRLKKLNAEIFEQDIPF